MPHDEKGEYIKQNGKIYRKNAFGKWKPEKDWRGKDKVEKNAWGKPKIEKDIWGNQKVEKNWRGKPIVPDEYKKKEGCYLTTACMYYQDDKFDDNCIELMTLRKFRDSFVKENYPEDVVEYYNSAPAIVDAIENSHEKKATFRNLYRIFILPAFHLIEQGHLEDAYEFYKEFALDLKRIYIRK